MIRPTLTGPLEVFREQVVKLWGIIQFDLRKPAAAATAETQMTAVDTAAGNVTITMPPAAIGGGRPRAVYKATTDANTVTVTPATGDSFGPAGDLKLSSPYDKALFISDGDTTWIRFVNFEGIQTRFLFTRFDDRPTFVPIYAPDLATMTFSATGGMAIKTLGPLVTASNYAGIVGVKLRGRLFPDATTGKIVIRSKWTTIDKGTDAVDAVDTKVGPGMLVHSSTRYGFGVYGRPRYGTPTNVQIGTFTVTDHNIDAINHLNNLDSGTQALTDLELRMTCQYSTAGANERGYYINEVAASVNGGAFTAITLTTLHQSGFSIMEGYSVYLAMFFGHNATEIDATLTEFEVEEGIVVPD